MEELPLQISAHKAPADGELDGKWRMVNGDWQMPSRSNRFRT